MAGPQVGGGKVEIQLDGKPWELVPSLDACLEIARRFPDGLIPLVRRCNQLDFDTICMIVGAGLEMDGKRPSPAAREKFLPKAVYEAGVVGVAAKCVEFIGMVMNGGRPPEDEEEAGEEGEGPLESAT